MYSAKGIAGVMEVEGAIHLRERQNAHSVKRSASLVKGPHSLRFEGNSFLRCKKKQEILRLQGKNLKFGKI